MSKKKGGKDNTNLKQEEILTAVVLADDFSKSFHPVDLITPKCLLPLANKPLLYYTLQFLTKSSVKQIYIYCANCGDSVKEYIQSSKWKSPELCGANVQLVQLQEATCIGDVFRHIDDVTLIPHDFIFVPCDVISNAKLTDALEEHKQRRQKMKDVALLTVVMNDVKPDNNLRMLEEDIHVIHDKDTNRIYRYDKLNTYDKYSSTLPLSLLRKEGAKVQLNYSLIDTGIWICSPNVGHVFADNFDYYTSVDFIKGVIDCEEFLGHHIFMHVLESAYCCRVANLKLHQTIQQNVINRWLYPITPELIDEIQLLNSITSIDDHGDNNKKLEVYNMRRNSIYIHNTSDVHQFDMIKRNTIIGPCTIVNQSCEISNTSIGKSCHIKSNTLIKGSTLMDNVIVGERCQIINSIICSNVVLGDDVIVEDGCILCDDVRIKDKTKLKNREVIYLYENIQEKEKNIYENADDDNFDISGRGFTWDGKTIQSSVNNKEDNSTCSDSDDSSSIISMTASNPSAIVDVNECIKKLWGMKLCDMDTDEWKVATSSVSDDDDVASLGLGDDVMTDDDDDQFPMVGNHDLNQFEVEVTETIHRKLENTNISWDNLFLEINGSKHANNISVDNVVKTITKTFLQICLEQNEQENGNFYKTYQKMVKICTDLLVNYIKDEKAEEMTIEVYQQFAIKHQIILNSLPKIFMLLYNENIIDENSLIDWYDDEPEEVSRSKVKQLIEWLKNAEEESESDEDSD